MDQSHYFLAPIQVSDRAGFRMYASRAMISRQGIYRIFEESEALQQAFLEARVFTIFLEGTVLYGRLVREQGADGTYYNLRLINVREANEAKIAKQLKSAGFEAPWKREAPRIAIGEVPRHIEFPATVAFPRLSGQSAGEVVNFSKHGMLFELLGPGHELGEFVGQKLEFHLITSQGKILGDIEARVAKIYDEMVNPTRKIRGLGIKFSQFKPEVLKQYQDMVEHATRAAKDGKEKK